jgi:3-oxoacyl-[acyl-carrier protein] reductase
VAQLAQLDVLVNNAGIAARASESMNLTSTAPRGIDNGRSTRLVWWRTYARSRRSSRTAAASSRSARDWAPRVMFAGTAHYATSTARLSVTRRKAARDLGYRNITVNVVQAGIMPIDMAVASADHIPAAVLDMHPIRRIATLEEVAASVIHLADPDAGYIMGSIIDVSGGVLS